VGCVSASWVRIADSALLSSQIIKEAKLVVYNGAPHGMCTTLKDRVNAELLAFFEQGQQRSRKAA
jgi:non-heme chloroperoxidase